MLVGSAKPTQKQCGALPGLKPGRKLRRLATFPTTQLDKL